jgi:carbamoyltransferase
LMDHAYWGPAFEAEDVAKLLSAHKDEIAEAGCTVEEIGDETSLCRRTASAMVEGAVVGWFQGRMEWGPRALGNRSILCDPRRADMKAILNMKIKRRDRFVRLRPLFLRKLCPTGSRKTIQFLS